MEKGRERMKALCTKAYQRMCTERFNYGVRVEYKKKREGVYMGGEGVGDLHT